MVARSEWYVGTRAGGMDQAASILGRRDHALFIEFDPLRVRAVRMPPNAALVVADSREVADKSGKVRAEYNRRVVECALAARILGRALKLDGVKILGDVVRALPEWNAADLVEKLAAASPARLGADLKEAASILGVSQTALDAELLGHGSNRIELDSNRPLEILKRARHVLSETERVIRAADVLEAGRLDEMGTLMNASHQSLADDFECSTARLDAIVECARRGGALGARLTGAGFGGSIVALCDVASADAVIESIDRGYYAKLYPGEPVEDSRAVLHAGAGASVIDLASTRLTRRMRAECAGSSIVSNISIFSSSARSNAAISPAPNLTSEVWTRVGESPRFRSIAIAPPPLAVSAIRPRTSPVVIRSSGEDRFTQLRWNRSPRRFARPRETIFPLRRRAGSCHRK